jgi:hypothetical protein
MKQRYFRSSVFAVAIAAGVLSLGSQDSCNTVSNVGLWPAHYDDAASPPIKESSWEEPVIVTRDNPLMVGIIATPANGVKSIKAGGDYNNLSKWENLQGSVDLFEYRADHSYYAYRLAPILPAETETAPAFHNWGTRSFDLIHGNTYRATLSGMMGESLNQFVAPTEVSNPLWLKLSDDVQLVPVVVVSLMSGPDDDSTFRAKALFDFIPYHQPSFQASQLSWNDVKKPNQQTRILDPAAYEEPPDDIWDQCNVQTQVVASFAFDMGPSWNPMCSDNAGFFLSQVQIENMVASTGWFGQYLVDTLQPVFAVYASACESLLGPVGNTEYPSLIEVKYPQTNGKPITAHEIGHVLLGPQHSGDLENLMRAYPAAGKTGLTAEQCAQAWNTAASFSDRYREFNIAMDRAVFSPYTTLVAAGDIPAVIDHSADEIDEIMPLLPVCCEYERGVAMVSNVECMISGGQIVSDSECTVCCADELVARGELVAVSLQPVNECSDSSIVPKDECDQICCSEYGTAFTVTRWECGQAGGSEISCGPPR